MLKRLAHVAIAVQNLDRACAFYREVLGGRVEGRRILSGQKVEVAFVVFDQGAKIELLSPTEEDSPLGRFLRKHGPGLHHIAFEVDHIEERLEHLVDHGVKVIDKTPRPGAEDDRIAFLHPSSTLGTLIEISEPQSKVH
jgi:methylmalonyl-CoA/ethylmalonyl-CoA epimerase